LKKLVAYITTGYPSLDFTVDAALALAEAGVDTLELGMPFSDPVADGPVIEKANLKALENGFKLDHLFEASAKIAPHIDTLWMGYFNPFYHKGMERFIAEAKKAGVNGFIIPDLPMEEAKPYKPSIEAAGLNLIDFIAPTDTKARIEQIVTDAKKFIYLVAYAGITGAGKSEDLQPIITNIKAKFCQFTLDTLSRPCQVFFLHFSDKFNKLPIDIRSADSSRFVFPIQLKAFFMPADNCRWLNDNQS